MENFSEENIIYSNTEKEKNMEKLSEEEFLELITKKKSESVEKKDPDKFLELASFIEQEYFVNFLDKIDEVGDENIFAGIKEKTGLDVLVMKEFIDNKIPILLEKIREISKDDESKIAERNSFRDILGNSVTMVFKKIVWLTENFNTQNVVDRERIDNPTSGTRKIIDSFSEETAVYYIDKLCQDDEILKLELETEGGYLKKVEKYFKIFPTGSKRAIYFRFFSELENCKDLNKLKEELEIVRVFENKADVEILDKEKVISDFEKGEFIF